MEKVREIVREGRRVADEDPRRVVHSLKVGLVLTLVFSFYYCNPLYDSFGVNAMWAVMTVVVVFEFSVGATLGKGINRLAGTILAGALGIGAHQLASMFSRTAERILLAIFIFILATSSTFVRFFPRVKARYDYGLLIFILTFALISVSGFREGQVLMLTHKGISTVIIGGLSCIFISIVVCPVWAGQDLHSLTASNLEKLSSFLLDFGDKNCEPIEDSYTKAVDKRKIDVDNYKSVLNSKSNEESLANFAKWEPGHGQFRFRHPWKQYLVLGDLIRQCAYRIHSLNSYLNADVQVSSDIKNKLEEPLRRMSSESGKALKQMSISLKKMIKPSSSDIHVENANASSKYLTNLFNSGILKEVEPLEVISLLTTISLLIDITNLTEKILKCQHELASAARFKNKIEPPNLVDDHVVTITEDDGCNDDASKNDNQSNKILIHEKPDLASAARFNNKIEPPNLVEKKIAINTVHGMPSRCHDDHVVTITEDDGCNDDASENDNQSNKILIYEKPEDGVHSSRVSCGHTNLRVGIA